MNFLFNISTIDVLCWDLNLEGAVDFSLCWASCFLVGNKILGASRYPMGHVMSLVMTMKLELKCLDWFVTGGIVAYNPHFRGFAKIVLIFLEENFSWTCSRCNSQKASNLIVKGVLQVSFRELHAWPLDIDHSSASKCWEAELLVRPIFLLLRSKLRSNAIFDGESSLLMFSR